MKLARKLVFYFGMAMSSFALTVFIILGIQNTLPQQLVNILIADQSDGFPLTFQTVMWYPFALGIITLILRAKHVNKIQRDLFRLFKKTKKPLESLDEVKGELDRIGPIQKYTSECVEFLLVSGLETILESSRYGDVKDEIMNKSNLIFSNIDSVYSRIKYLSWLLPTLGFMGTVYGISAAVSTFGSMSPDDPALLQKIAETLSIAFDTTLLSLLQSAILILIITFFENAENEFSSRSVVACQEYCRKTMRSIGPERPHFKKAG